MKFAMVKFGLGAAILLLLFLLGCSMSNWGNRPDNPEVIAHKEDAIRACRALCNEAINNGVDISSGPCLSKNNPDWNVPGWVCDIAHSPRKAVDDLKENQCPEYGVTVSRFVELSQYCTLIRARG